ncbi:MAG: hypothetical protein OCD02_08105 [Spirochaetaceae bacterium]
MKLVKLFVSMIALLAIVSCDNLGGNEDLGSMGAVTVVEGGECLDLSWSAVANAQSYNIFYTSDGTEPTTSSSFVETTETSYTDDSLDETLTYRYMVQATASDYNSSSSDATDGNMPMIMLTVGGDFTGHPNKQLLVVFFEVPYVLASDSIVGDLVESTIFVIPTSSSVSVSVTAAFDRTKYFGYTYCVDEDNDGTISTGDIVMGSGANGSSSHTFVYYEVLLTQSYTLTRDFDEFSGAEHTY